MDKNTQLNMAQDDDEISLWDIVDFLKEGWRWLGGGLLLGLVCAVAFVLVAPKKYEAQALFHGAKVLGSELESSAQLIERLKFPTFYGGEQVKACDNPTDNPAAVLAKQINPVILKGTNILQVTSQARNSELAVQCLDAVMDQVIAAQNKQSFAALEGAKRQLELTKAQLAEAERVQLMFDKRSMGSLDAADAKFSQTVLLLSATLSKKEEIQRLRKSVLEQMTMLEPPYTQPAELIEPIYAPGLAVFPKKLPVLVGGGFGGLVLGGLAFLVRRSWLGRKSV